MGVGTGGTGADTADTGSAPGADADQECVQPTSVMNVVLERIRCCVLSPHLRSSRRPSQLVARVVITTFAFLRFPCLFPSPFDSSLRVWNQVRLLRFTCWRLAMRLYRYKTPREMDGAAAAQGRTGVAAGHAAAAPAAHAGVAAPPIGRRRKSREDKDPKERDTRTTERSSGKDSREERERDFAVQVIYEWRVVV